MSWRIPQGGGEITYTRTHARTHTHTCACSHQLLEKEVESESGALQQRLEVAEETLEMKERELAEARERISNLFDELVISQGKVCV